MSDQKNDPASDVKNEFNPNKKKILENNFMSGITVPIAIVLVGALIIFGVTKMLSTDRNHRDLVQEMQSKTFGNRWIAAYELSKLVAGQSIPKEEVPWLIENLGVILEKTIDERTKNFIVITFGSLRHRAAIPYLEKAIDDKNNEISFNALVAVGNLPEGLTVNWAKVMEKLESEDEGLKHAAILALASKRVESARELIEAKLRDPSVTIRYAAATALVNYKSEMAVDTLKEILNLTENKFFNAVKLQKLKIGVVAAIGREKWRLFENDLAQLAESTEDLRVETTTRQALNLLKN